MRENGCGLSVMYVTIALLIVVCLADSAFAKEEVGAFEETCHARVAVVGAGISGASTALFLRELLGPEAEIVVLERLPRMGGRIHSVDLDGVTVELGARQFHSTHYYLSSFVTRFNLTAFDPLTTNSDKLGIWACDDVEEGKELHRGCALEKDESAWAIINGLGFFWKYLTAPIVGGKAASRSSFRMLDGFVQLEAGTGVMADSVEALAALVGMYDLSVVSTNEYLGSLWGMTGRYIQEVVSALLRLNGGNTGEQNAFSGLLELQQTRGNLYALEQGLERLTEKLLETANVDLRHCISVHEVKALGEFSNRKWHLTASYESLGVCADLSDDREGFERDFDAVIFATGTTLAGIKLLDREGEKLVEMEDIAAGDVYVTITVGSLRIQERFGVEENLSQPQKILTRGSDATFYSLIVLGSHPFHEGKRIYRITSPSPLSDIELDDLFDERGPTVRQAWPNAMPHLLPSEADDSHAFRIADGIYSTVPMEYIISSLEIQAMAAKNVALLVQRDLISLH